MILRDEYDIIKAVTVMKGLDLSKPHELIIKIYDPKKTNDQCSLYWKWVDEIREVTGEHKIHQDINLRELLLTPTVHTNKKGEDKNLYPSISQMGKKQMSKFMEELQTMAGEYGIHLTDPTDMQRNE
tara:strand:+ start:12647 stop:13027 length:381 start_codon:yes stop_codon:yes gene_type:complete